RLKTPSELTAAIEAYKNIYDAVSQQVIPLYQQANSLYKSAYESYRRCRSGYYECQAIYDRVRPQIQAIYNQISALWRSTYPASDEKYVQEGGWRRAAGAGSANLKTVQALDGIVINQSRGALWELYNVFDSLRRSRNAQYTKYMTGINRWNEFFEKDLRRLESLEQEVERRLKYVSENSHTYLVPRKDPQATLAGLPGLLTGLANMLQSGMIGPGSMSFFEPVLKQAEDKFEEIKSGWDNLPVLSKDEIDQINVLVSPSFDYLKEKKRIEQEMPKLKALTAKIRARIAQFERTADTDANNRSKDAMVLQQNAARVQSFLDEMDAKKIFKYRDGDYRIDVKIDPAEKMVILDEPYKRYALASDIQQITGPVKAAWQAYGAGAFVGKYFPDQARAIEQIINLSDVVAARDENFIMNTGEVIYAGDIKKAAGLISSLKPGSAQFDDVMKRISILLPRVLNVRTDSENKRIEGMAKNIYKMPLDEYMKAMRIPEESFVVRESAQEFGPKEDYEIGKAYRDLVNKLDPLTKEHLAHLRAKANEERQKKYAEEERRRKAEQDKANKQAAAATMTRGLADYYGYYVVDPRINAYSLANARGDVILTRDEIQQGTYNVTGRMSTLQRVAKMLISVDGGRGWNELPLADAFSYSFTPIPDVSYQFLMRVQTVDQDDITFDMLEGVDSITYKNVSFKALLLDTVKAIAEAYERVDFATFSSYISRDYLGQRVFLEEGVRFDFDMFTDIRLTIYINRIEQRSDGYVVETSWQKSQTPRKTGQQQRTTGKTTFMFVLEDGIMKIRNLRGDLIYATLSPEIAQASGLSSSVVDKIRTARDERNPIQPGAGSTPDSGGLTDSSESSTAVLSVFNASLNSNQIYDFSSHVVDGSGDIDMFMNELAAMPGAQITETTDAFDNINEITSVVGTGVFDVAAGKRYLFQTKEGYYGKMEVLTFLGAGEATSMTFRYAVQQDGTSNVRTQ
ncbi:MAG: hypothetical protein PHV17_03285, partial [Candidatus Omnitrophica bacterium]|nr:hypothetical protein [Candidatus Omnitrophota bacterium]